MYTVQGNEYVILRNPSRPASSPVYNGDAQVVALIGASRDRNKFGNKAVRAFRHRGYDVVPINLERA